MGFEQDFLDLYQTFLTEVSILSAVDSRGLSGPLFDRSTSRNFIVYNAIQVKLGETDIEDVPSPFKDTVANFSSKIDVQKNTEENSVGVGSKDPFAKRIIAEFDTMMQQENRKSEYVGVFKVTNFTNLFESTLTALCSWSLKYFEPKSNKIDTQSVNFKDFGRFNSIEELRTFALSKYINGLTYRSAGEWIVEIANIIDPKITKKKGFKSGLDQLTELYLRRNLFVHNSGKVNYIYLASIPTALKKEKEYQFDSEEYITADDDYIKLSFSQGISVINLFFQNRIEYVAQKLEQDKESLNKFFGELNNLALELYRQNYFKEGNMFFQVTAELAKKYLGEKDDTVFLYYYNKYLGLLLSGELNNSHRLAINKLFTYTKKLSWWDSFEKYNTVLSESSLTQNADDFCDTAIEIAQELNNGNNSDKQNLADLMQWPMLKIIENKTKWIKFVDSLYDFK